MLPPPQLRPPQARRRVDRPLLSWPRVCRPRRGRPTARPTGTARRARRRRLNPSRTPRRPSTSPRYGGCHHRFCCFFLHGKEGAAGAEGESWEMRKLRCTAFCYHFPCCGCPSFCFSVTNFIFLVGCTTTVPRIVSGVVTRVPHVPHRASHLSLVRRYKQQRTIHRRR